MNDINDSAEEFTRLWTRYQNSVFCYIRTLMPNWVDAEDVLQETGGVLWRKYGQFDPQSDFRRWACKVAYYEALKHRERATRKPHFSNAFMAMVADRAIVMIETAPSLHEGLSHCMEKLPIADQRLLSLRHASDMTINNIAAHLQRSSDGVRKSLRRIYRTLFECVEQWRRRQEHA